MGRGDIRRVLWQTLERKLPWRRKFGRHLAEHCRREQHYSAGMRSAHLHEGSGSVCSALKRKAKEREGVGAKG